jgi:hypothetical protein
MVEDHCYLFQDAVSGFVAKNSEIRRKILNSLAALLLEIGTPKSINQFIFVMERCCEYDWLLGYRAL